MVPAKTLLLGENDDTAQPGKTNWSRLNDGIALLPSLLTPSFSFLHSRPIRIPSFTLHIDYTINDDKQNRITREAIEVEFESKKEQTKLNWIELN